MPHQVERELAVVLDREEIDRTAPYQIQDHVVTVDQLADLRVWTGCLHDLLEQGDSIRGQRRPGEEISPEIGKALQVRDDLRGQPLDQLVEGRNGPGRRKEVPNLRQVAVEVLGDKNGSRPRHYRL